ncbi:DUF485 domain-containing protein [Brevibacillus sp. SYP-B805]|uniref:DUF485 domain-containing protein n=1 Tax=Brevibacillus sp. SYP-B805 TaxID=1578199 RepID=UPI0013ED4A78|nr:DUF485 domain-containing protein [Brevibacillus sp. SYP-B805]
MANTTSAAKDANAGKQRSVNYAEIARSDKFNTLLQRKKAFIVPWSVFFFVFYFLLPVLTSYSKVLNTPAVGAITWAWVFAFAQFVMTWALCILYTKKSREFDAIVEEIKQEAKGGNH